MSAVDQVDWLARLDAESRDRNPDRRHHPGARVTDTRRPPACHFDRVLKARVTRAHRDDCATRDTHNGCVPCTAPHCRVCGREHLDNDRALTCLECETKVQSDLSDISSDFIDLSVQALAGGGDGRLVAAAPIPGGDAAVLIGPSVRLPLLRTYRSFTLEHFSRDHPTDRHHRSTDPMPPLAILSQWEDIVRDWLGHAPKRLTSITGAVRYLKDQVPLLANDDAPGGPDFGAFARQVRTLRAALELALHDERDPERGVECFECGDRLVRRFRDIKRCRHSTPARSHLAERLRARQAAIAHLAGLDRAPTTEEYRASLLPTPVEVAAAKLPCSACDQGGIGDPRPGQSWECPGCRKEYKPGEYATAVRRDLLDNTDAWTTIVNASAAAATLTGRSFGDKTIRGWVGRGWVISKMEHEDEDTGETSGARLVFWPDVKREAMRVAAGRYHCAHRTTARLWLTVLSTYPELEVWTDEHDAAREQCEDCEDAVEAWARDARGMGVA